MKPKMPSPQHLGRDISQLGLALRDCARQIRYAARNVPGQTQLQQPLSTRSPVAQRARPAARLSLESVAHFADDLIETAETFAGHAVPPLQSHWKSPVPLESLSNYLDSPETDTRTSLDFSTSFYAAAKRMVMQSGAADVLIFEHFISDALEDIDASCTASPSIQIVGFNAEKRAARHRLCLLCSRLALSLLKVQPIRSTRFDSLPDAGSPWWLITEPNEYVFLTLSLAALAKDLLPNGPLTEPTEPDAVVRFYADVVGAREVAFRRALMQPDPLRALAAEFEHVVSHLR